MSERNVTGLKELAEMLNELPELMEKKIMRAALRKGAQVILAEAKARVPVALPNAENQRLYGGYTGALRDSLRVTTKYKNGQITATVRAGSGKKGADTYYAPWVEFGTAAHLILPARRKALFFAGHPHSGGVHHPGARPHPFMRPSLYAGQVGAIQATAEYIKKRLVKNGNALAGEIEVEVS